MKPLFIDPEGSLEWRQSGTFTRSYQLVTGKDQVVGMLEFSSAFGSRAEGRVADAVWSFKRTGFFSTTATARVCGSDENAAVYQPNWSGAKGAISLAGGERMILQSAGFWGGEWILLTESGLLLMRFHNRGIVRHGAAVEILPEARSKRELSLLLLFGWYVLVLHQEDSAAAAVMVAAG
jgi:hypothetical protein